MTIFAREKIILEEMLNNVQVILLAICFVLRLIIFPILFFFQNMWKSSNNFHLHPFSIQLWKSISYMNLLMNARVLKSISVVCVKNCLILSMHVAISVCIQYLYNKCFLNQTSNKCFFSQRIFI